MKTKKLAKEKELALGKKRRLIKINNKEPVDTRL